MSGRVGMRERLAEKEKRLKALRREVEDLQETISTLQKQQENAVKEVKSLENDLAQMKSDKIWVSDHAILRYLERAHYIDVGAVRQEMLSMIYGAKAFGSFKFAGFVVRNNTVVTYLPTNEEHDETEYRK